MARTRNDSVKEALRSTWRVQEDEKTPAPVEFEGETAAEELGEVIVEDEGKGKGKETTPELEMPGEEDAETAALGMEVETVGGEEKDANGKAKRMENETTSDSETSAEADPAAAALGMEFETLVVGEEDVKGKGTTPESETHLEGEKDVKGKGTTPESETHLEADAGTAAQGMEVEMEALMETNSEIDSDTDLVTWNVAPGLGIELGNHGLILVLFETPSGFAILCYDGVNLRLPQAMENIWVDFTNYKTADTVARFREFQPFEDKTSAINPDTGVNEQLAVMIQRHIVPGQKLAVGKHEYKKIIEDKLGIVCLFDDTVMELMWGLKNCIHHFVPAEKAELTKEDRLHMSEGMKTVFDRCKLEVKPEMVNKKIIKMTVMVYCCDLIVNNHSKSLRAAGEHLKEISKIDSQHWCLFKVATALYILCFPEESLPGDPLKIFSKEDYIKLLKDGPLYEGKLSKRRCKMIFEELLRIRYDRVRVLRVLGHYVRKARKEYEAGQGLVSSI